MRKDERIKNDGSRLVKHSPSEDAERADARKTKAQAMPKVGTARTLVESGKAAERAAALVQYRQALEDRTYHEGMRSQGGAHDTEVGREHDAKAREAASKVRDLEDKHPGIYHMALAAAARERGHTQLAETHEKAAAALNGEWDEAKHPRDEQGRFT